MSNKIDILIFFNFKNNTECDLLVPQSIFYVGYFGGQVKTSHLFVEPHQGIGPLENVSIDLIQNYRQGKQIQKNNYNSSLGVAEVNEFLTQALKDLNNSEHFQGNTNFNDLATDFLKKISSFVEGDGENE